MNIYYIIYKVYEYLDGGKSQCDKSLYITKLGFTQNQKSYIENFSIEFF